MSRIKRSMAVRPAAIHADKVAHARHPESNDSRWAYKGDIYPEWAGPWGYKVVRVTNSTDYRPGFLLTTDQVDALIYEGWTVSVLSRV